MLIKVCGITLPQQAEEISSLGVDLIGAILYPKSPRYVDLKTLKSLKESINKNSKLVAVVVNEKEDTVRDILKVADLIQFHGDEDYDFIKQFDKDRVIKVFRLKDENQIKSMEKYMEDGYTILVDTYKEGMYGGTGESIDLNLLKKVVSIYDKVIVSGGIGLDNVKIVIDNLKPYGIDASSKLEVKAGVKDIEKVKEFVKTIKNYEPNN